MKLLDENPRSTGYIIPEFNSEEVYLFGDFLRRTAQYMKDSDKKWEFVCKATDIQDGASPVAKIPTAYPSLEIYHKTLREFEKTLCNHLGTHEDPFIIQ